MKKRCGFVSNSSSSSFILDISDINSDEFFEMLFYKYEFSLFSKSDFIDKLDEYMDNEHNSLKFKEKCIQLKCYIKDLKIEEYDYDDPDKCDYDEMIKHRIILVQEILKFMGLFIEKNDSSVKLRSFTIMYNDYNDINEAMQKIIVACSISNIKTKFHNEY
jgi:hypothetical protein